MLKSLNSIYAKEDIEALREKIKDEPWTKVVDISQEIEKRVTKIEIAEKSGKKLQKRS